MARFDNLHVYHLALLQVTDIAALDPRFGDLGTQMRRAAVSVVSNICEGAGRGTDPDFIRFLRIARGSNHELCGQIAIVGALGQDMTALHAGNQRIGRMLTALIRSLGAAPAVAPTWVPTAACGRS